MLSESLTFAVILINWGSKYFVYASTVERTLSITVILLQSVLESV